MLPNNVMLDPLPEEWNGFQLNTDFRIGVQIMLLMYDPSYGEYERIIGSIELLYDNPPEDIDTAMQGIQWFLNGWNHDNLSGTDNERCVDFDIDQWRIFSAFLNQYRIDLSEADMHWWRFMGLLTSLQECAYTQVVDMRQKKIDPKISPEQKKAIRDAKKIYAITTGGDIETMSLEEKERYDEFMKYANIKKK